MLPRNLRVSPNVEVRANEVPIDILVLHYTGMNDAERACDWLCSEESKVSCHYLVDESGGVTQMVDEELRAWHAGVSSWMGDTDVNSRSIGIEVQNPGHPGGYPQFPAQQMVGVVTLARDIAVRNEIPPCRVLAHSDVAPGRKIDPGEKFDWKMLHEHGVGHWVSPSAITEGDRLLPGGRGAAVTELQDMLKRYGYGISPTGHYDDLTQVVVAAFQRHFRPQLVDGVADQSTLLTLQDLLASRR
jgi:N-acetylmuramoyl-L-alanine amidase